MSRILGVTLGALGMLSTSAASALTFTVVNTEDSGAGSLRQAVLDANIAAGADAIAFDGGLHGQAIVLTSGPLEILDSVTITGPGPDRLVIRSDDPEADIVRIGGSGISVALTAIGIEGGEDGLQVNDGSNGIAVALANVRVARQLSDDAVSIGGALNQIRITDSVIEGSEDNISVEGTRNALFVTSSTVRLAGQDGIEIEGDGNALIVENSTINNNGEDPSSFNDGIDVAGSQNSVKLNQATISHNGEDGLDIEGPNSRVTIRNTTIALNGRNGIKLQDMTSTSTIDIQHSIVAANQGLDVDGAVTSNGYNLVGNGSGSTGFIAPGDQVGTAGSLVDARLGPLERHGGTIAIHAPRSGSPAVNAGDPDFMPPPEFDQRGPGSPRVLEGRIDIGAFEGGAP